MTQCQTSHISQSWTDFCMQDLCSQIAQVEYQGQILNARILDCIPVINTYYPKCRLAFKQCISFATEWAANIGCDQFRDMPHIVSKLVVPTTISSCSAVWSEPEQTPFYQPGRLDLLLCTRFHSELAVLFLCPILTESHSETNKWVMLWLVTTSCQLHQKFHFTWKTISFHCPKLTLELSQYSKSGSTFSSSERLQQTRKRSVSELIFACPNRPSCAEQPKELGYWFCSQNLRLSPGIAFRSDWQMTCRD